MNATKNVTNSSPKTEQISVLQFHGSNIVFEMIEGKLMVNATQMAKSFGQTPVQWLRTQQAKDLLKVASVVHKCTTNDLQVVRQGGINQGTWFQEDVALLFAQWLSPEFYFACNIKLKELLTKQSLILQPKFGVLPIIHEQQYVYPYTDAVKSQGGSTRSSASKRKAKFPQHFFKLFGRNFITGHYFDLLHGYYSYKNASNQLSLVL